MAHKLFLSHAHADKAEAQTLRRALEDSGVGVWEDALELRAGDRLADLEKEGKGSRGLLLRDEMSFSAPRFTSVAPDPLPPAQIPRRSAKVAFSGWRAADRAPEKATS